MAKFPNQGPRARLRNINWVIIPENRSEIRQLHPPKRPDIPSTPSTPSRIGMNFSERVRMIVDMRGNSVYKEPYVVLQLAVEKTDQQIRSMMEGDYFLVFVVTQLQEMMLATFQLSGEASPQVRVGDAVSLQQLLNPGEHAPRVIVGDEASHMIETSGETAPKVIVGDEVSHAIESSGEAVPKVVVGDAVSLDQILGPGEHIPVVIVEDSVSHMIEFSGDSYFLKTSVQEYLEKAVASLGFGSGMTSEPWLTQDNLPWRTQDDGIWLAQ